MFKLNYYSCTASKQKPNKQRPTDEPCYISHPNYVTWENIIKGDESSQLKQCSDDAMWRLRQHVILSKLLANFNRH